MENKATKSLRDVQPGESCLVTDVAGQGAIRRRLMDMGLTKGTQVYVRKLAPLGDPMEITLRGYELSLRKGEAENVLVK